MSYILLRDGKARRLVWGADASGKYRAREYFEKLSDQDQAKFQPAFDRFADTGNVANVERFRRESNGIVVFKTMRHRLAGFSVGRDLVLIHGFVKKTTRGKKEARALKTAERLRDEFLDREKRE